MSKPLAFVLLVLTMFAPMACAADGPGKGRHIVLLSGDEEYRSEEGLPQLGKILRDRHGFKTTVLFSVNPETGEIDPKTTTNIPGIAALDSADLVIMLLRFRDLPDEQMKHVDAYLKAGKPVIGLRTATHAFNIPAGKTYAHYSWTYKGDEFMEGFGRQVLGETWISHHGSHKNESTRGLIAPGATGHPILRGIRDGEIWGATDVYGVRLPLPGDSRPLLLGQVLARPGPQDPSDRNFGMKPTDEPLKFDPTKKPTIDKKGRTIPNIDKNNPMMPIAWTKSYQVPGGKKGQAFTCTMGSSTDLENEALRRLIVNASYHLLGLDVPAKADVTIVGDYQPTAYGFNQHKKGVKPADALK